MPKLTSPEERGKRASAAILLSVTDKGEMIFDLRKDVITREIRAALIELMELFEYEIKRYPSSTPIHLERLRAIVMEVLPEEEKTK